VRRFDKLTNEEVHLIWDGLDGIWAGSKEKERLRTRLMAACELELKKRGLFLQRAA